MNFDDIATRILAGLAAPLVATIGWGARQIVNNKQAVEVIKTELKGMKELIEVGNAETIRTRTRQDELTDFLLREMPRKGDFKNGNHQG